MLGFKINLKKRIFGFDLLRAFAIFCVVHRHGSHLLEGTIIESFPWIPLPHGVDIFFVLSGFLIGYSLIVNANKTNDRLAINKLANFWKRSALRILPNYYLILYVNYILVNNKLLDGTTDKFNLWSFITFTQNLFSPFYDFFWESWSLATQEWFYLLFPLFMIVIGRVSKLKYSIPIICVLFFIISISYRLGISNKEYDKFWWDVNFRKVTLSRIDCIYFGVMASWIRFYFKDFWVKYAKTLFMIGILLFILVSYVPKDINSIYTKVFHLSIAPIYISLCFPLIDKIKDTKSVVGKLITYFSILSYSMYLLNLMIIQIFDKHFSDILKDYATLKYFTFWLITVSLSYALYTIYENPISNFGNKFFKTTKMMYKRIGLSKKD